MEELDIYTRMDAYTTRLSPNTVGYLMKRAEIIKVHPGHVVVREGDRSDFVYIVIHGVAVVEKTDLMGNKTPIARVETGSLIGEMGVFLDMKRSATITAETEMTLLKFTNEKFINSLPQTPDLTVRLLKTLADKVNELNMKYSNLTVTNTVLTLGFYILDSQSEATARYDNVVLNIADIMRDAHLERNHIMTGLNSFLKNKIITQWTYVGTDVISFKAHIPELKAFIKNVQD